MNFERNDKFLQQCRDIDFSAHSQNQDKNLETLKAKLAGKNKESSKMKTSKNLKKTIIIAAVVAAVLSLSVVALAAGPMMLRQLDTRVVQGEQYVRQFERWVNEGEGFAGGTRDVDMDVDHSVPIIVEVDGVEELLMDRHTFYDLEDALSHLAVESPRLPSFLPEGFAFEHATFSISPVRNPDHETAANMLNIIYSNDAGDEIQLMISYYPAEWGGMSIGGEEIIIDGHRGQDAGGWMFVHPYDTLYSLSTNDIDGAYLRKIAESLFQ